jgi:hypothetical protein
MYSSNGVGNNTLPLPTALLRQPFTFYQMNDSTNTQETHTMKTKQVSKRVLKQRRSKYLLYRFLDLIELDNNDLSRPEVLALLSQAIYLAGSRETQR